MAIRQAVILAGGLGTRLRSIVSDRPKPMAAVAERPLLEYQIEALRDAGIGTVVLAIGHLAQVVMDHFQDGSRLGVRIEYAIEKELLGTAGAIRNAMDKLAVGPLIAMNGDSIMPDLDYRALIAAHERHVAADDRTVGTLVTIRPPNAGEYGVLELDESDERIIGFKEKAPVDPATARINGGVYALEWDVFEYIAAGRPVSIEYETYPGVLSDGRTLWAQHYSGFFGDIGTPEGYERVARYMQQRQRGDGT
ncbi:MAG: NTP transferase domain-containing protein [Planctomycetes bacterium]|nr:NTP transferase domain-containing protein [Planctomycetota bacterium]